MDLSPLYIQRNYLIKVRDRQLRDLDITRDKLRELNRRIYELEKRES